VRVDRARVWIVRVVAPLAFVAAAVGLVVVVQRALEDRSAADATPPATLPDTVEVTTVGTGAAVDTGEAEYYRIKEGDTLEQIASEFGTTVEDLLILNPEITDPLAIQPGQRIRVA
jgi:hypothetical protein